MENVKNTTPDYNCFGCSPDNKDGLKMEFTAGENEILCRWKPDNKFQGYKNILHGGIVATLMDEAAAKYVHEIMNLSGVTSKMEVRYLRPVFIDGNFITIRAALKEMQKRVALIKVELMDIKNEVCSDSIVHYFTIPKGTVKEQILSRFPDKKELFD